MSFQLISGGILLRMSIDWEHVWGSLHYSVFRP